jgi:hypothetical protein
VSSIPPPSLAYPPQCTYPLFPLLPLRLPSFSLGILTLHAVILSPSSLVHVLGRLQTSFCVRDNGLDRRPLCSCLALLLFSPTARLPPTSPTTSLATTSIRRCASEACMSSPRCSRSAARLSRPLLAGDAVPPVRVATTPMAAHLTCYATAVMSKSPHLPATAFPTPAYDHSRYATPARTPDTARTVGPMRSVASSHGDLDHHRGALGFTDSSLSFKMYAWVALTSNLCVPGNCGRPHC